MARPPLTILYEDDYLIAIDKPAGLLVHHTKISEDTEFALQLLRNQIKQWVYPIHRIDRATSGVLLFSKTPEVASKVSEQMRARSIGKQYVAIIRGYVAEKDTIDYPLDNKSKLHLAPKEAITQYTRLDQTEMEFAVNRYPTSRYSLVNIKIETGRKHQIRRHFAHIRHPILGDKTYGDCKHNNYFREQFGLTQMMLHANSLECIHPVTKEPILFTAPLPEAFQRTLDLLKLART